MPDAILFVPSGDHRWLDLCGQYAARRGYTVIAVVSDWADVQELAREHNAVVVYARDEHLPPDRLPRVERALEDCDPAVVPPSQRRPRLRRWEAD